MSDEKPRVYIVEHEGLTVKVFAKSDDAERWMYKLIEDCPRELPFVSVVIYEVE